eukprot:gnl/Chilomastix_cuspidata/5853.p1 GENE.gnl/Chilomastix_cuspidata/5853~~gnl/Chilomastix_cuspidata/5853.p1  ORF type:complete len:129 (-),score=5.42 gnl/Chilomastix_cuspidata/5853:24-410(-)
MEGGHGACSRPAAGSLANEEAAEARRLVALQPWPPVALRGSRSRLGRVPEGSGARGPRFHLRFARALALANSNVEATRRLGFAAAGIARFCHGTSLAPRAPSRFGLCRSLCSRHDNARGHPRLNVDVP